jgi:hypothetical protein
MDRTGYAGHIVVEISLMVQRRPDYDPLEAATESYRVLSRAFDGAGVSRVESSRVSVASNSASVESYRLRPPTVANRSLRLFVVLIILANGFSASSTFRSGYE